MRTAQKAFTLVELSIVLVILGLLVGGVLAGQSLIHSTELRSIITEKGKLNTALYGFKDKYNALPGDMPNAFNFWGTAGVAGCAANTTAINGGCNGDNDGKIGTLSELFKAPMHLSLAGLIEGNYDGAGASETATNMIKAKYPSATWALHSYRYVEIANGGSETVDGGLYITLLAPTLTLLEAFDIDKKVDDGRANFGSMRGNETADCIDQHIVGDPLASWNDFYSIIAAGPDKAGDCTLTFILK
jgi:prepilin-type N-terminal cleavage/methylation domain-containing protein